MVKCEANGEMCLSEDVIVWNLFLGLTLRLLWNGESPTDQLFVFLERAAIHFLVQSHYSKTPLKYSLILEVFSYLIQQ